MATLFREGAKIITTINVQNPYGVTIPAGTKGEVQYWDDEITVEDRPVWFVVSLDNYGSGNVLLESTIRLDE